MSAPDLSSAVGLAIVAGLPVAHPCRSLKMQPVDRLTAMLMAA